MFWYPALVIALLILVFLFCLVAIAHAELKPRVWNAPLEWEIKEHRSIKVPGLAKKITLDEYRMALAEKNAVIIE